MAGDEPNIGGFAVLPFAGGETIYKWFENGSGPSQSTAVTSQSWRDLSTGHGDVARLIEKAVSDSGAAWEGSAGDAARGATSPLATWATVTGESATQAGTSADAVGEAYVNARNAMAMPPKVPDKPFLNDMAWWDTDYDKAVDKNQQVSEQNMRAFNQYGSAVTASANNQPTFISPNADDASVQEGPPDGKYKIDEVGPGKNTPPGIGGNPGGGDRSGVGTGQDDGTSLSGWKPPTDSTNPAGIDDKFPTTPPPDDGRNRPPTNIGDPNVPPGGRFDPNDPRRPGGPLDPNNPRRPGGPLDPNNPRNRPGGLNGPGGGGGGAGGGRGGGAGGGAGGLGGAAAARGMGGPGAMGAGAAGFGGAAGVAGEGAGRGAGGFGPAGAGAAGAAGRGGAAGMGGGMGAGGGRGEGAEDGEHKSASYLQETEDIFGDGTMVAPPVIGG
ncbi:PPE domain-containing protein [Lentzea sp. JNUCC 0626]|uniref:PPE domain-containing protein n=1 Tax=Lentzea sp. JNUCC 0626 TaxID=3367513 RepID=UPI00374A4EBD